MNNAFLLLTVIAAPWYAAAQQRSNLIGKLSSPFQDAAGVYVINRATEEAVVSGVRDAFTIAARAGDTLAFAGEQYELLNLRVEQADLSDTLHITLKNKARELDELIIVDYRQINAESLRLVPEGQKQYTPAERELGTASSYKLNPMGLDPLFNRISGRTKMLEKAYETEKKETVIVKLQQLYDGDEIISKFNIPANHVMGFYYFAAENKYLAGAVESGNSERIQFMLSGLAVQYLKLLNEEK